VTKRHEWLGELREEVYNAENVIDGCYNPYATEVQGLGTINKMYIKLVNDMNSLLAEINKEL
jgi:hypothetical protein